MRLPNLATRLVVVFTLAWALRATGAARRLAPEAALRAMLRTGRDRLLDEGLVLPTAACDAEHLPFASNSFDLVSVAFGLRNMTHKDRALAEMRRVLRPGGRLLVLEFSRVWGPLRPLYDTLIVKAVSVLHDGDPGLAATIAQSREAIWDILADPVKFHEAS